MVDQSYYKKADEIIEHYERCAASLIPIMQDIQAEYRYLPAELLTYVAGQIGVTEAKAFSVATFLLNLKENTLSRYAMAQPVM
jgi:NADH-quinone oxidoreductase subunit E